MLASQSSEFFVEDADLELAFRRICGGANYKSEKLNFEIMFADKKSSSVGLQLADLAAASEKVITHARLRAVTTEHPVDLSKTLQHLTQVGMLESTGGRGAIYHLPGEPIPTPDDVFGPATRIAVSSSPNLNPSSPNLGEKRNADGCLIADQLLLPVIDDLNTLSWVLRGQLETIADEPRTKNKVNREILTAVILQLCSHHFVTLRCLAALVNRKPETLRDQYLTKLVRERKLTLAFPTTPTHERQAYCSSSAL